MTYGVSVGRLITMTPEYRARSIAALSEGSRMKLAHLASLGIRREMAKLAEYQAVLELLTAGEDAS